ncbi:MAG: HNH endonuclease [bacterium]|nr:HNH endonuclease [bacterium]
MSRQDLLDRFAAINVWRRGDVRAPHKPLLLLFALARLSRGEGREVRYSDVHGKLGGLLTEFGPVRKSVHPEYPFWRLQHDGLWVVRDAEQMASRKGKDDPKPSELKRVNPAAGLTADVDAKLRSDPTLLAEVVGLILEAHFPSNLHEDILTELGMQLDQVVSRRRPRDPAFRERVLRAYERRCAVCGFDVRLGNLTLALEAAHIKWHQAGGPDIEPNGLALCSLHHKLLDRGAFTLSAEKRVLVSQDVCGSDGLDEVLLRWHGREIRRPQSAEFEAGLEFVRWHEEQVFKTPAREF